MEHQRSVLIVDDDNTLRATLQKIFAKAGYEAETARNGQDAIRIASERGWDLVLADLKMPGKDGLALLDEILEVRPESKVIIMTAYGTDETREDALRRGAYAYLDKPVSRGELLALCEKALRSA
jgi:DNA-binding NtrC family response regulator